MSTTRPSKLKSSCMLCRFLEESEFKKSSKAEDEDENDKEEAEKNGAPDNHIIDQKELSVLEPQIRGTAALFVGCTGNYVRS